MPSQVPIDRAALLAESYWRVFPHTHAQVTSGGVWNPYDYQRMIGSLIARAVAKGNGRIIINAPSGHGKSDLTSFRTPVWYVDNYPENRLLLASYGMDFALDAGRKVRNEFLTNPHLLTRLSADSQAAGRFNSPEGGGLVVGGPDGAIMGRRFNAVVIDDPHKSWEAAHNPTLCKQLNDWFSTTLYSRLEPNATIVVVMQRFSEGDFTDWLVNEHSDKWTVVRLPSMAEPNDPLGRPLGAALCPQRYDVAALERVKANRLDMFEAMFQQRPQAGGHGTVYYRYRSARNDDDGIKLRDDLPLQLAWDFNVNPGVHCLVGQYDRHVDVFTEAYEIFGERMKTPAALVEFEKIVRALGLHRWAGDDKPGVEIYGDRSGNTENTQTTKTDYQFVRAKMAELGLTCRVCVPSANPPIKSRVDTFNDALCDDADEIHYRIHPRCKRLLTDLKNMKEGEDGLIDKADKKLSHPSDAAGYRIFYQRPLRRDRSERLSRVLLG